MFHALFWIIIIIRYVSIDYSNNLVFRFSLNRSAFAMIYADDIVLRRKGGNPVRFGSDELSSACLWNGERGGGEIIMQTRNSLVPPPTPLKVFDADF